MRFGFDLDAIEGYVNNNLRLFIFLTLGLLVFVGIIALSVFFIAVRGMEQTMVPDVVGKDLTGALLELQVKELYPRVQLRYSQSAQDKGLILEQEPLGGTIVKAGRRIRLVVSQGVVLDSVGDYVGRNIQEVRMDLQTLFVSLPQPLLFLQEPFMYAYSETPSGTILQQKPEPGTALSGPVGLELVISRGPERTMVQVPELMGLSVSEALEQIDRAKVNFVFSLRPAQAGERGGIVAAQEPEPLTMAPANVLVSVTVAAPSRVEEGEVYALFSHTIAPNAYPLPVRLEAQLPSEERRILASVNYPGGNFTVPYRLPVGSTLILFMLDREIYREEVQSGAGSLSPDQMQ
ncbi:MAG: PASTA domain-containing protein [Treponema sp.]|jgi:beta-lactam-binding protein with PASTA domain|nr:PASTA domain-containing protein [Treponema sp.]